MAQLAVERNPGHPGAHIVLSRGLAATGRHERKCQVVNLRFFVGLQVEEIATLLEVSPRSVKREWSAARLWLFDWILVPDLMQVYQQVRASLLGEMDYGVHISIVGSLVLTFVISMLMNMGGGSRGP